MINLPYGPRRPVLAWTRKMPYRTLPLHVAVTPHIDDALAERMREPNSNELRRRYALMRAIELPVPPKVR